MPLVDLSHAVEHDMTTYPGLPGPRIGEHLTALDRLPARGAVFSAVPVAVRGMATFPVRAYAVVP